jgi:hypothetical protein
MPTVSKEFEVDVDLDEFEDDDLIEEMKSRGFHVTDENGLSCDHPSNTEETIQEMIWRYKNGQIEDAMILLERCFPEMYGIHKLIVKQ